MGESLDPYRRREQGCFVSRYGGEPGQCRRWRDSGRSNDLSLHAGACSRGLSGVVEAGDASKGERFPMNLSAVLAGFSKLLFRVFPADLQEHRNGVPDHLAGFF